MARPFKQGLSYFPLDTNIFDNRKILRLIDKYGSDGTVVYFFVLCEIYASEGYFVPFSENLCFDISFTFRIDETRIKKIIAYCVEIHLFDNKILKKHRALSSVSIQERYLEVVKRLKRKSNAEILNFKTTSGIPGIIPEETSVNPELTPQREKEKERKGKENKIKENQKEKK
ncbi:MAG: DUF4373 domain-containing protein [Bacteroidales bacterium]|jgi:hypothetical protein|nr:DUF4373 domain-containing protein [Bacteroidales bacterium]